MKLLFVKFENGVCQLTIDKVQITDGGDYICVAENFKGQAKTKASLIVTSTKKENIYSIEEI